MEPAPEAPVLGDLLAHAAWVRALARSLVADAGAAEDVVQDTWVAALERPPARDENLRGWLATVVRNVARMRGRGSARRARREARVASERSEALPSSAELAERLETQRLLARRVLALDEPYRSTVILRYYEGLSSADIARRTGVPAGTVRWRLKAALDELRGRLDEDHGGQRAAWLALVLPLARRDVALTASAAGGAGLLPGILAMNLGLKLTLAAAVAALTLFLTPLGPRLLGLFPGREPLDDTPVAVTFRPLEPEPPALATPSSGGGREVAPPPASSEEPDANEPARAVQPEAGFRLRVVEPDGTPVSGATVGFQGYLARSVSTDADGFALLVFDEALPFGSWMDTLVLRHPRFASRHVSGRPEGARVVELGDVVLTPAGAVEGRVLTADGQPAADAWVVVNRRETSTLRDLHRERVWESARAGKTPVTDALGRFRLDRVPIGEVRLWAGRDGDLATLTNPVEVRRGMLSAGVEIRLGPADPTDFITGQVLRPDGTPASGATVRYEYASFGGSGSGSLTTRRDGTFRLACVPDAPRTLSARDDDGPWAPVRAPGVRGGEHVILQLVENEFMALALRANSDTPILEPRISCFDPDDRDVLVEAGDVRLEEGRWLVPIPLETFGLEVTVEGYERAILGPFGGLAAPRELEVELERLPGIRGTVTAAGSGVAGVRVELYALAEQRTVHNGFPVRVEPRPKTRAETDAGGAFELTPREPGEFIVRATLEGHAPAELGPLRLDPGQGRSGLELELRPGGAIEGRVHVADGRAAGRIVAASRGDAHAHTTRCRSDGSFRFEHLVPGRWQVELTDEELIPGNSSTMSDGRPFREDEIPWNCEVLEGETTRFDVDAGAHAPVELTGTLSIDGAAASGWSATLIPQSDMERLRTNEPSATLDATGAFRIAAEEPGEYRLSISGPGTGLYMVTAVLWLPAGRTGWSASFETGEVRLTEIDEPSESHLDLLIAERGDFALLASIVADDGRAAQVRVPAGSCRVQRFGRGEVNRDPLASGRTLLRLSVEAGGVVEARMP